MILDRMVLQGQAFDVLKMLSSDYAQCCVTSPPYYGLRDYGVEGQIGLEETPEEYVGNLVDVFREVRRVLRGDGLLWFVIGDSYSRSAGSRQGNFGRSAKGVGIPDGIRDSRGRHRDAGIKDKDLMMIPAQVALALRADGWFLRDAIVWHKPNPMPGSQRDRCTSSYEMVYMLAKKAQYYFDTVAIREPDKGTDHKHRNALGGQPSLEPTNGLMSQHQGLRTVNGRNGAGRTKRNVWTVATTPFKDAHFAVFPSKLIEPMILAGSSDRACAECGAPWRRVVERTKMEWREGPTRDDALESYQEGSANGRTSLRGTMTKAPTTTTIGWEPTCGCNGETTSSIVLDPFCGAGTTGKVATELGRRFVGIELSEKFCGMSRARIERAASKCSAEKVAA